MGDARLSRRDNEIRGSQQTAELSYQTNMKTTQIKRSLFQRAVSLIVSVAVAFAPLYGTARAADQRVTDIGKDAASFGEQIGSGAQGMMPSVSGGNISINLGSGNTASFTTDDLSGSAAAQNGNYRYDKSHFENLEGLYESGSKLDNQGESAKESLYQDATGDKPSIEGMAYGVVVQLTNQQKIDMANDAVLTMTKDILANVEEFKKGLADCSADEQIVEKTGTEHIPDLKHCSQVLDRTGDCKIYHQYEAGVIRHHDGPFNLSSCGEGCTQLWIGKVGNDYWSGWCTIYEQSTQVTVPNPEAITHAVFEYAKWDDYMIVQVGEPGKEETIWTGPNDWQTSSNYFPPETPGTCELSTSWERNPNIDVTQYFKNVDKDTIVSFKIRVSVAGEGEGYGRIKVYFDPSKAIHDESWSPNSCIEAAYGVSDGFATGQAVCIDMPELDEEGCTWMDGVHVCPDDLNSSPVVGVSNLCKQVQVNANFGFYKGQMDCFTDANGQIQCPVNEGGNLDSCEKYANDSKCGFISSTCVDGATGKSGLCYVNDVVYDCGEDVETTDKIKETTYECPGDIACMGSECVDTSTTISTDFAQVTALMNATQYMVQDMACTGMDEDGNFTGTENVSCTVFQGESGECKIAVGGWQDCCESPGGTSLSAYISLIKAIADLDSSLTDLSKDKNATGIISDIAGSYVDIKGGVAEVVNDGVSYISKPFANYIENIAGEIDVVKSTIKSYVDRLMGSIQEKCSQVMQSIFKEFGLGDSMFQGGVGGGVGSGGEAGMTTGEAGTAATGEASGMLGAASSVMAVVGYIYMAYVIANMIVQIAFKCTEDEYALTAQRDQKQCHYIGSYCNTKVLGACIEKREVYCCFKSPLARILNEQIRLQGDILGVEYDGFGSPKNPKCTGVPLDKIDRIDWSRIDLSEWIALLKITGNLPTDETVNLESLTGKGSKLDTDGTRLNTLDRVMERLEGSEIDATRSEASKRMDVDTGYRHDGSDN